MEAPLCQHQRYLPHPFTFLNDLGLTFKQRSKSWKETFLSDIQDTCTHLGQVSRRDIEELWIFLQSLYNKGEDLKYACALCMV